MRRRGVPEKDPLLLLPSSTEDVDSRRCSCCSSIRRTASGIGRPDAGPEPERPPPVRGILHRRRQQEGWGPDLGASRPRLGLPTGLESGGEAAPSRRSIGEERRAAAD
jgi:hypothetical protein